MTRYRRQLAPLEGSVHPQQQKIIYGAGKRNQTGQSAGVRAELEREGGGLGGGG
jgi:hypothetical protein